MPGELQLGGGANRPINTVDDDRPCRNNNSLLNLVYLLRGGWEGAGGLTMTACSRVDVRRKYRISKLQNQVPSRYFTRC